jgi:isopentenyldiphosphate isomerase
MPQARSISPHLASLCKDNDEILAAVVNANLMTSQDLGSLAMDADLAADKLKLSPIARGQFASIFAITKARAEDCDQGRMQTVLDVLNGEGQLIMRRPRCDVHRQGFWHRAVNVWILCTSTSRVLMAQRAICKDVDKGKWTCVCMRVPSGELSHTAAVERLEEELSIRDLPDEQVSLIFSMKCPRKFTTGIFSGQDDAAWVDVYVAVLKEEIPIEKLHLDVRAKQAAKYVSLADLKQSLESQDEQYVIPSNPEYVPRLFHHLRKTCEAWQAIQPK